MNDKLADLAIPGVGTYEEVDVALPLDDVSALTPRQTMEAVYAVRDCIEEQLRAAHNTHLLRQG